MPGGCRPASGVTRITRTNGLAPLTTNSTHQQIRGDSQLMVSLINGRFSP